MKDSVLGIIPARMASTRFPGKPMANIHGMPMIGHIWSRCKMSKELDEVWVATCDQEIFDYIESIGGRAVMTADTHERCSDRTAEGMEKIEKELHRTFDMIAMIQGDEPMVTPLMIDEALHPMKTDPSLQIVNLMADLTHDDPDNPHDVKVVTDLQGNALYFSREAIPSRKKVSTRPVYRKQVPVIPFRRDFLLKFNALEPTPLEMIESVDMMRVLEHGFQVRMVHTSADTQAVDTPEDLVLTEKLMAGDPLMQEYVPTQR